VWSVNTATGQGGSGPTLGPYAGWTAVKIATGADGKTRLLWDITNGVAAVWALDGFGIPLSAVNFGPYAGWTATDIAVGSDGNTRLLWDYTDGTAVVWSVNTATNQVSSGPNLGPYAGWTATHLATG